jgi:hypothetical protein
MPSAIFLWPVPAAYDVSWWVSLLVVAFFALMFFVRSRMKF